MPEVHAKLSASGAKRWMACPPSVALEAEFPNESSVYAEEGTHAHALAELILRYNNGEMTKRKFNSDLKKLQADPLWSQEMQTYIEQYAHDVWELVNEAKAACKDAQVLFEQRLDFSAWVEEGFGTGDVVIIADGTVHVIDLKFGKGVGVSALDNPQLRLYGLGALDTYGLLYDIDKIKMTIIQPRLEHTDTEELTVDEIVRWAEEEVKPMAELAYAGEGEYCSGDHCRFCKAKGVCRARAEENLKLAQYDFREPPMLTPPEIADILGRVDKLKKWVEDVANYALDAAVRKGIAFPGWKVVEGRSNRKYKDEIKVAKCLVNNGFNQGDVVNVKLKGLGDLEKLVGKAKLEELVGDLIIKPQGAPTLVPESDKRPVFQSAEAAKADFDDLLD